MDINGIEVYPVGDQVEIALTTGQRVARQFTIAEAWNICQELGAAARQAQQHSSKLQAEQAGVRTSEAPKISRRP